MHRRPQLPLPELHSTLSHGDILRPYSESKLREGIEGLEVILAKIKGEDLQETIEERRQRIATTFPFDEFCDIIDDALGGDIKKEDLKGPYRKLTTMPDAQIDWAEFFGYFQRNEDESEIQWVEDSTVFSLNKKTHIGDAAGPRRKRDCIQSMIYVPSIDSLLTVSQKGTVIVWNHMLRINTITDVQDSSWCTAIAFLEGIKRVFAASERSFSIFDHRAKGENQQVFSIKSLTETPRCACWIPLAQNSVQDTLIYGDDQGGLNLLTVTMKDLTAKQVNGAVVGQNHKMEQSFDIEASHLEIPIKRRKIHNDWVQKVKYIPELKCLASCSACPRTSFFLHPPEHLWQIDKPVNTIPIPKGVNCFDYCKKANVIITAGVDKIIRVWHPHIWTRPTGKLSGHMFSICDLVVNQNEQHIISLSTARVFRVWDIQTMACLQVFNDQDERPGEKRIYSIVFDERHNRLICGSSVIESYPLTKTVQEAMQVPHTHDRSIVKMIYNPPLNQFITLCQEPVFKIWDCETGRLILSQNEPLGSGVEITSMTINNTGYRLALGAIDGTLSVWDLSTGEEVRRKRGYLQDEESTGIVGLSYVCLDNNQLLLAMGWNDTITIFLDNNTSERQLSMLYKLVCQEWILPEPSHVSVRRNSNLTHKTKSSLKSKRTSHHSLHKYPILPEISSVNTSKKEVDFEETVRERSIDEHMEETSHEDEIQNENNTYPVIEEKGECHSWIITCHDFVDPNHLVLGTSSGDILWWHLPESAPRHVFRILQYEDQGEDLEDYKVNAIRILRQIKSKETSINRIPTEFQDVPSTTNLEHRSSFFDKESRKSHESTKSSFVIPVQKQVEDDMVNPTTDKECDETSSMEIVDEYYLYIFSAHADGRIRFWDADNTQLVLCVVPQVHPPLNEWTALAFHMNKQLLVAGDKRGYNSCGRLRHFFDEIPTSMGREKGDMTNASVSRISTSLTTTGSISTQVKSTQPPDGIPLREKAYLPVCYWRAHLSRVQDLLFVGDVLVSASVDNSVRLYRAEDGCFLGFFGQTSPFKAPLVAMSDKKSKTLVDILTDISTPYDISEKPHLIKRQSNSAARKAKSTRNIEYPLMFAESRWDPFNRTRFFKDNDTVELPRETTKENVVRSLDRKYFKAIMKPRAYNHHLMAMERSTWRETSVFGSLPVYRVRTPDKIQPPEGLLFDELQSTNLVVAHGKRSKAAHRRDILVRK